jgi:hypothetical protein
VARWSCILVLVLPLLAGCKHQTNTTAPPERPGLFTIYTDLGPVDVLAFEQEGGHRSVRLHAVYPDGHHAVRTIKVDVAADPSRAEATQVIESVWGEGAERIRVTRNVTENESGLDAVYRSGEETLRLVAVAEGTQVRFQAELNRSGGKRAWEQMLDPGRASNAAYVASVRASFADFYGSGPFRENEDLALLLAVEESPDWSNYLDETPIGLEGGGQSPTERNIHRVCTAANVIGKVTCFAARFTPWAMIGCVPATGISLACLAYNVYQLTGGGQPDPLPPPNPCTCGCPCNHGD